MCYYHFCFFLKNAHRCHITLLWTWCLFYKGSGCRLHGLLVLSCQQWLDKSVTDNLLKINNIKVQKFSNIVFNYYFLVPVWRTAVLANQMEKLQDLSQSELQELLDSPERVESMALESDEVKMTLHFPFSCHFWKAAFCGFQRAWAFR